MTTEPFTTAHEQWLREKDKPGAAWCWQDFERLIKLLSTLLATIDRQRAFISSRDDEIARLRKVLLERTSELAHARLDLRDVKQQRDTLRSGLRDLAAEKDGELDKLAGENVALRKELGDLEARYIKLHARTAMSLCLGGDHVVHGSVDSIYALREQLGLDKPRNPAPTEAEIATAAKERAAARQKSMEEGLVRAIWGGPGPAPVWRGSGPNPYLFGIDPAVEGDDHTIIPRPAPEPIRIEPEDRVAIICITGQRE